MVSKETKLEKYKETYSESETFYIHLLKREREISERLK